MVDDSVLKYHKRRLNRFLSIVGLAMVLLVGLYGDNLLRQVNGESAETIISAPANNSQATATLTELPVKGRAAKTGYSRSQFGNGWASTVSCDVRNEMLQRDLESETLGSDNCTVLTGTLLDPYTNKVIQFTRGQTTSDDVQIDHVVALSDAWQKGAQQLTANQRLAFANDPLNLLAVDGPTNNKKGDGDAATWLPPNKAFRCDYVSRQIAVKKKYNLWVTTAEFNAINSVLSTCPDQTLPN